MKKVLILLPLLFLGFVAARAQEGGFPVPLNLDLLASSDSGPSNADNYTNAANPQFTISNIINGATVELLRDSAVVATLTGGPSGNLTFTDPSAPANAVCEYKVRQTFGPNSSLSIPLTVTFDNTRPTLTINQAAGQADPTAALPVKFTVILSEAVGINPGLLVTTGSTTNMEDAQYDISCSPSTTCTIDVRGIDLPGLVKLTIAANTFSDAAGNQNFAATSTDNTVEFQPVATTINFTGRIRRAGAGGRVPQYPLTVLIFDDLTNQSFTVRTNTQGYFRVKNYPFYQGTERVFTFTVFNKNGELLFEAFNIQGGELLLFTLPASDEINNDPPIPVIIDN
jgi:hypothetical protein